MKHEDPNTEARLEAGLEAIREEPVDPAVVERAAGRVWARIGEARGEPVHGCEGFRALMPAYLEGELAGGRRLLLIDHVHECVGCRKALEAAQAKPAPAGVEMPRRARAIPPVWRWAMAAAVLIGAGVGAWEIVNRMPDAARSRARVESVEGALLLVSSGAVKPVAAGAELPAGSVIRTGNGSRALVRLADGSMVETGERSEFSVSATRRDLTVDLGRGRVIVQAAKQRQGHLYVLARDCRVAVTGTVFSVNSGLKGARVSVVEGQVRVAHKGGEHLLAAGQQYSSSAAMEGVPVGDEIAWSRNFDAHIRLLREFQVLEKQLEQVRFPDLRYSSRLLDRLPADTVIYAGIPNLGRTIEEAHQILRQRVAQSPVLEQWWNQQMRGDGAMKLDDVIRQIRTVSDFLGDEIVLAASRDASGRLTEPVFLAEVKREGLVEHLEAELERLGVKKRELPVTVRLGVAILSPSAATAASMAAALESGAGGFRGTAFHGSIASAYRQGAGFLFGADLWRLCSNGGRECPPQPILGGLRHLVIEQKEGRDVSGIRAVVTLEENGKGLPSMLSEPAPMGAIDFFSPDAVLAAAFAFGSPVDLLDQLLAAEPAAQTGLAEFQSETGVDLRQDVAASLGGELAAGVDGALLPVPAWKIVVEVNDPSRLQYSIGKMIEAANRVAAQNSKPGVGLVPSSANGRTYYQITGPSTGALVEAHYTYVDGYLVAAGSRALVDAAIQNRSTRYTLASSQKFASMIPRDPSPHFSGVVYQNAGRALGPLAEVVEGTTALNAEQRKALEGLTSEMRPSLLAVYREKNQLTVATTSSLLKMGLNNLFGVGEAIELLGRVAPGKRGTVRQ